MNLYVLGACAASFCRDNGNLVNETKNLKEKLSSSESIVAQATAQMEAMQQKLEERLDIMQRGAKLNKEGSENVSQGTRWELEFLLHVHQPAASTCTKE